MWGMILYLCQEERATDTKSTMVEQKFSKKCKKPLDKRHKMCYNIRAVRTGTH